MLFMVISTPRPEQPSLDDAEARGLLGVAQPPCRRRASARAFGRAPGRGAIALLDVPDNETLHRLMNEWAEIIPATFEVYPVIDPGPAKAYLKKIKK